MSQEEIPEEEADDEGDGDRLDGGDEGEAGGEDQAGGDVSSQVVRAQPVHRARRLQDGAQRTVGRVVRRDIGGEDRRQNDDRQDNGGNHRGPVAAEALEECAGGRQRDGGRLFDGRGAHQARTFGSK